ncbi:secapin [Apis cerana]|uniref:Secapin-2 n=2 Tax=Aculeata TaxID=7434 RepID=SECP2_APIME|nr:secapin [Apis cerana]I1VC85.1 RecName: Full=Secapin-2; Flags: Precursor [Apis mellifera]Q7YWA9.1 RecName: Full=Secapin; Flags: Precursor [Vespula maculifrons]AAQ06323.1 preprosecapin [Vespula maculifrons]AFI40557.1 secapin [Apis mellifera]
MKNYSKNATYLITVLLFSFVTMLLIIPSKCEAVSNDMQPLEARTADLVQQPRYIIDVPPRCPPGSKFVHKRCRVIVP